jgi:predicted O-methyltransferase YrrM
MGSPLTAKARAFVRAAIRAIETPREVRGALREALAVRTADLRDPAPSADLESHLLNRADPRIESRDLFTVDGLLLPCWLESDLSPADPWLTSPSYYPLYYSLFRHLTRQGGFARLLEIGVRTGYVASVFARAAAGRCFYLGIDPNVYIPNGLDLASHSLRILRNNRTDFEYALLEGYSSDTHIQKSAMSTGPYELVHIDGDHSLKGKLIDLFFAQSVAAPGGLVLVDDYDHHGSVVRDAVERALALGWFDEFAYLPSHRGLAVLRHR